MSGLTGPVGGGYGGYGGYGAPGDPFRTPTAPGGLSITPGTRQRESIRSISGPLLGLAGFALLIAVTLVVLWLSGIGHDKNPVVPGGSTPSPTAPGPEPTASEPETSAEDSPRITRNTSSSHRRGWTPSYPRTPTTSPSTFSPTISRSPSDSVTPSSPTDTTPTSPTKTRRVHAHPDNQLVDSRGDTRLRPHRLFTGTGNAAEST